jgi:hypothetical protein
VRGEHDDDRVFRRDLPKLPNGTIGALIDISQRISGRQFYQTVQRMLGAIKMPEQMAGGMRFPKNRDKKVPRLALQQILANSGATLNADLQMLMQAFQRRDFSAIGVVMVQRRAFTVTLE